MEHPTCTYTLNVSLLVKKGRNWIRIHNFLITLSEGRSTIELTSRRLQKHNQSNLCIYIAVNLNVYCCPYHWVEYFKTLYYFGFCIYVAVNLTMFIFAHTKIGEKTLELWRNKIDVVRMQEYAVACTQFEAWHCSNNEMISVFTLFIASGTKTFAKIWNKVGSYGISQNYFVMVEQLN